MSLWIPDAKMVEGETVDFASLANAFQGRRAVGGRLTVTNKRIIFVPNRLDALLGGKDLALNRSEVIHVGIQPPGKDGARKRGLNAMMNEQVKIESDKMSLAFVVADSGSLVDKLGWA